MWVGTRKHINEKNKVEKIKQGAWVSILLTCTSAQIVVRACTQINGCAEPYKISTNTQLVTFSIGKAEPPSTLIKPGAEIT